MDGRQPSSKRQQAPRILKFLSEHESQSSQLHDNKFRNNPSAKIMRKLKELWNRQHFLTDDEYESSIDPANSAYLEDSSMNYQEKFEVEQRHKREEDKRQSKRQQAPKRQNPFLKHLHRRQLSSSDQKMSLPQKMKKRRDARSENKNKQKQHCNINGELSEIEAFSSAIEGLSSS